jgi:hypothetical protein
MTHARLTAAALAISLTSGCGPTDPQAGPLGFGRIPARVTEAEVAARDDAEEARRKAETDELKALLSAGRSIYRLDLTADPTLSTFTRERLPDEAAPAVWTVEDGWIRNDDARNQGLWLEVLPSGGIVRVTFTARSRKPPGKRPFAGDLKVEAFATEPRHEAGYSFINGGWSNRFDTIARTGEHSADERRTPAHPIEQDRVYRYDIVRRGPRLDFLRDGVLLYTFQDADPVRGRWFGFNNWLSAVEFKDLEVFELPEGYVTTPPRP